MILTLLIGPRFLATNQEEENKGERTLFLLSSLYQLFFFFLSSCSFSYYLSWIIFIKCSMTFEENFSACDKPFVIECSLRFFLELGVVPHSAL